MARIAPLRLPKRPARTSLRHVGIPGGRDLLAVYFWWVRQRYYRAQTEMGDAPLEAATSVRTTEGDWEPLVPLPPPVKPALEDDLAARMDFQGLGAQFESSLDGGSIC
ncbi:hypothetical protein K504DRAFT_505143 [Pleomassaria siparia CBS 279.74]|uniref:Uncharacterized protein n=1 Tax=Pleomassaria siparia CBS 279.74 TaxID=1314801 RepID=A0A6G1K001_9PLEO|nr:hypothetical protein K504DRAFT_505143 [Pleomassaria siparia CBS 279.74]